MASNLGRIVAHAGHPARLTDAAASTSSTAASTSTQLLTGYMCVHLETCVRPCTSIDGSSAGHTTAVV